MNLPSLLSRRIAAALLAAVAADAGWLAPVAHAQDAAPAAGRKAVPFARDARGPIDLHKDKTLYVVPYAHLDTQWRWAYPQVIREYIADTLHRNFKLIDKYPNYVFNFSGSRRYEMMHEYYPEDWERLKGYIKAGRWFPCGSSVDEDDANVPSLESMVRHILYGNHYFRREFGVASDEFMLPDCFGFPAALPTILAHCGIKGFSTQKLTWHSAIGIPFKIGNWVGPDGGSVIAALDPGSYSGGVKEDLSRNATWLTRIERTGAESGAFADYHYYGTGDRGGAPDVLSVHWMEESVAGTGPLRVVSANAQQMFQDFPEDARARLPRYQGDLLLVEHSAGSITSQAYMKRWNRKNELLADAAERAAVAAAWLGGSPYPSKKLLDAWGLTLGSQMHDMLPGTSLPKAYEYCWNDDLLSANQFAAVAQDSVGAVAAALDTTVHAPDAVPVVVYNPLSVVREDVVTCGEIFVGNGKKGVIHVVGPDGKEVPAQVTNYRFHTMDFMFLAKVPPMSFTTYEAFAEPMDTAAAPSSSAVPNELTAADRGLENKRYRVRVNDAGDVASIFDKEANRELLAAPMRLEFHQENPQQFPAWNMDWADRQKPARGYVEGRAYISVEERGPVRATLRISRDAEGSSFVSRVSLCAGGAGDSVDFHDTILWKTREASLKAAFTLTPANPLAAYDDKIGVVMRGNNEPTKYEVPQHEWFDLTDQGGEYGVSVLNDCKFGSDKPDDHTMRLTLLYTPGVRGEFQDQATQDFGRHDIAYAVAGHRGDWRAGGTVAQAHRFNQPLRAFVGPAHPGALGRAFSFVSLDNPRVEITALKKAEDSDEIIVRLRETGGQAPQSAHLHFAAPVLSARAVDGQERPLKDAAPANLGGGQLAVEVPAYGLRTFALKPGAPAASVPPPATTPVMLPFDEDVVSARADRADGSFDHDGRTYPAEGLPETIISEGIPFKMGSAAPGAKNALACRGQSIPLPDGDYNRVVFLAASEGDKTVEFNLRPIGDTGASGVTIPDWSGYVGQWDNRLWKGAVPETASNWANPLAGLVPGFVKPAPVAWYSSHRHERGGDGIYQYCYLFKYAFALPAGSNRTFTLPNEPGVRIFAMTLAGHSHDDLQAAHPLYDTLRDDAFARNLESLPRISSVPENGPYHDTVLVTVTPGFYSQEGAIHYTLDGSPPTVNSPRYTGPIALNASATVRVSAFLPGMRDLHGSLSCKYDIDDRTPPTLRLASASTLLPEVRAVFSEPVEKASAEAVENYRIEPADAAIQSVKLSNDGMGVRLTLAARLGTGGDHRLVVNGVRDRSPAANAATNTAADITLTPPIFYLPETVACDGQHSREIPVAGLPVGAGDAWTLNLFVRTDRQPDNRTIIAGFGTSADVAGKARYLSKFANGIHYWSGSQDGETSTPLDVGRWQMLSATYDGARLRIYKDAVQIGEAVLQLSADESVVKIAPLEPWDKQRRFHGEVNGLSIWKSALPPEALASLLKNAPAQ